MASPKRTASSCLHRSSWDCAWNLSSCAFWIGFNTISREIYSAGSRDTSLFVMVEVVALGRFLSAYAEAISLTHFVKLRWSLIGGWGRRNNSTFGEIGAISKANAAVSFWERAATAIVCLLASRYHEVYSGLGSRNLRLFEKEWVTFAGDVLARCLRISSLLTSENFFITIILL